MCLRVGTGSLKLESVFLSEKSSTTSATYFIQHFLKIAVNGLFRETSMGWHFKVQPVGMVRVSVLLFNNCFSTPSFAQQKHQMLASTFETLTSGIQPEYV